MVFENATLFHARGARAGCPPPTARMASEACLRILRARRPRAVRAPFTICRPFNCVGGGPRARRQGHSLRNVRLAMSHVVPGPRPEGAEGPGSAQDPGRGRPGPPRPTAATRAGHRHRDVSPGGAQRRLQPSTPTSTTVRFAARLEQGPWDRPSARPFRFESDPAYPHDVARRIPDTSKARRVLGFDATTSLSEMLDEVVPWIRTEIAEGRL